MLRGAERLGARGWEKLLAGLSAGDPDGEVAAAWLAKEELRRVYGAVDAAHARRRLTAFYSRCADAEVPELVRLATTVAAWQDEVLAYHATKLSNGPTEAVNLLVKKVKRAAHGNRFFENYRLRLLLHCGVEWDDAPTARIRGRRPPLVA